MTPWLIVRVSSRELASRDDGDGTTDCGCTRRYVPGLRRYPGVSSGSGLVWSRAAGLGVGRCTKPFRRACARDHVFIEVFLEELFQFRAVDQRDAIAVGELLAGPA